MNNEILINNVDEESNLRKLSSQIGIAFIIFALLILLGGIFLLPVISSDIGNLRALSFKKIINTVFSIVAILAASAYLIKKQVKKSNLFFISNKI